MSIATLIVSMQQAVNTFFTTATTALKAKQATVFTADNTASIGATTVTTLVNSAAAPLATHTANLNNPHGTTAAMVGGLSTSQIDAFITNILPLGITPISQYGPPDAATVPVGSAGAIISFPSNVPCVLAGNFFLVPGGNLTIPASPGGNTVYYLYVVMTINQVAYVSSPVPLAETTTRMYIGSCTIGPSGISAVSVVTVTRLDTYRISTDPVGSGIAATTGQANVPATIAAGWKP